MRREHFDSSAFANALRDFLGLGPLPHSDGTYAALNAGRSREERAARRFACHSWEEPTSDALFVRFPGDVL